MLRLEEEVFDLIEDIFLNNDIVDKHGYQTLYGIATDIEDLEEEKNRLKILLGMTLDWLNYICKNKEFCINCPLNDYLKKDKDGKIVSCRILDLIKEHLN